MPKYKIAVQMFGHLRTFNKCSSSLRKRLLRHYDCDIFIHSWDELDHKSQTWHNYQTDDKKILKEDLIERVYENYPIKDIEIEKQNCEELGIFNGITSKHSISGIKSMYHSMTRVNKLRENYQEKNKIKYDFVLMIRPDILLKEDFNIDELLGGIDKEDIAKSVFSGWSRPGRFKNDLKIVGGTDLIFFAKEATMSVVLNNCLDIVKELKKRRNEGEFVPEFLFSEDIRDKGYNFYYINYHFDKEFIILRRHMTSLKKRKIVDASLTKKYLKISFLNFLPRLFTLKLNLYIYKFEITIGSF
ncbi:MAG: hypothetical protein JJV93_03280 [Alphaproteobacteria bacterium]|nr:hypothetical protein [Alphaproteobacteria bacterium]MBL0718250.1 hypothetical protein [Alphaproteobacteria bacterium]